MLTITVRATVEMSDAETCESLMETTFNMLMKHNFIVKDNYTIVCQVYNRAKAGDYSLTTEDFDRITAMLYNELALTVGGKVYNICMRYLQSANTIFLKKTSEGATAQHSGVDETGRKLSPSAPSSSQSVIRQRGGANQAEILNIENQIEVVDEEESFQAGAPPAYESIIGKRPRSPTVLDFNDADGDEERILMNVARNLDGSNLETQQQQQQHQEIQQQG